MVLAAARRGARAVGVDIALRWLVIARRQLAEAGVDAPLFAADGAMLPFRAATFDVTTSIETLEHAADQRALLHACLSSVRPGGQVLIVTANRYSVAPEPNVRLWLVGYLPRRWMDGYVRRRRGTRYQFFRAVSAGELRGMIGPRTDVRVGHGPLPPPPRDAPRTRLGVYAVYERALASPFVGRFLGSLGPFLSVTGRVGAEGERSRLGRRTRAVVTTARRARG
jgi:SAM-dependent methyltransferase